MKKIKLACLTMSTALATVTPLIALTSCKDDPKTSDIDIKSNPNVKVTCSSVTVGQKLVIKYKLDSGFAFNAEKSSITFSDSNVVVWLWQCDLDRVNQTITVPAELVTSKKVTIDIKAENASSSILTQPEYLAAMALLETESELRKFTLDGPEWTIDMDKDYHILDYSESSMSLIANGFKEYQTQLNEIEGKPYIVQNWTEADKYVGYWTYAKTPETENIERVPAGTTLAVDWFGVMFDEGYGRDITKIPYDPLFNAYYFKQLTETREEIIYLKFNDKKVSYMGELETEWLEETQRIRITSNLIAITYTADEITMPTEYIEATDANWIHDELSKYEGGSKTLTYKYDSEDTWMGRYTIPMSESTWTSTDPIKIMIEATEKRNLENLIVKIWNNDKVLVQDTDFTVDNTTGEIKINAGVIDTTKKIIMHINSPLFRSQPVYSEFSKMTITQ